MSERGGRSGVWAMTGGCCTDVVVVVGGLSRERERARGAKWVIRLC